jgi:CRISPR-associated protein Csx16
MANYFISRHTGAIRWFCQQGIEIEQYYPHCTDLAIFNKHDVVYGNLPIHLVEILTSRSVRYFNLVLDVPSQLRGTELTGSDFEACLPRFIEYQVITINPREVLE